MSVKDNSEFLNFDGIAVGDTYNNLPVQTLPQKKKNEAWRKACMDALESISLRQMSRNIRFVSYRNMADGVFSYDAVGLEDMKMPFFDAQLKKLSKDMSVPTYLQHFDFIGIIVRVLTSIYGDIQDRFIVDSRDEYATNEFIRKKTEMLHEYARSIFMQEVNQLLLSKGIDPYKSDFQTGEEAQAYQQQVQQQVQALTPPEIEKFLSKNFKVIATEWAQHVIENDKKRFDTPLLDAENFVDYLLSGRYFKHFRVGYDSYTIERWKIEETFFSEDVDAKYPQDGEYVGRTIYMAPSKILLQYGHLMSPKEQEQVGNYWNHDKDYYSREGVTVSNTTSNYKSAIFPKLAVAPFHNYYDHQINVQFENALGLPAGKKTIVKDGGEQVEIPAWIPRHKSEAFASNYSSVMRHDIDVRKDTVRVTEAYWRSYKRMAVLIFENKLGSISVEFTTDDLLKDFLIDNEIKNQRTVSIQELKTALQEGRIEEYINTITYIYTPEIWKGVKIQGNGSTIKDDLYLGIEPLEYQIKGGNSNMYDVKLPVAGIIDVGMVTRIIPYQKLHNIAMNQMTELIEKELGVFYTFDITGLPSEYQNERTDESVYRMVDTIKDSAILPLDLSRQNTQGNNPNVFQRQEIVFTQQVQYRLQLAQFYKQEALNQIGITPQLLGQPNTYVTAEGVKQGMEASFALIDPIFDKMASAKAREMELHISIAQYCQANGKDQTVLFGSPDQDIRFLDIIAEDGEIFPLRMLNVYPTNTSRDRKIVEQVKQFIIQDNTINKTLEDTISILTDPSLVELGHIARESQKRMQAEVQQQREFEQQLQQQQIEANIQAKQQDQQHELNLENIKGQYRLKEQEISSLGRLQDNNTFDTNILDRIQKTSQDGINNNYREQEIGIKQDEVQRKKDTDNALIAAKVKDLEIKQEKIALEREKLKSNERIALYNKN
jgi:hypothetical protein